MKIPPEQMSKALAEKNGWTLEFADGFLNGEYSRKFGAKPSPYGMVGRDEYCLGFRAGYFERGTAASMRVEIPAAPERTLQNVSLGATAATPTAKAFEPEFTC
jgi:hypothetical protein